MKVKRIEEGIDLFVSELENLFSDEVVKLPIQKSLGLTLAEDILAKENLPSFSKSTVDGYALISSSTTGASSSIPTLLEILESVPMGEVPLNSLQEGQATKVMTGGMIPDGANAVAMVEDTQEMGETFVAVYEPVRNLENVIQVGDDCKKGDLLFEKGTLVTPKIVGACAALGIPEIDVFRPLKVRIVSTGDEILPIDVPLTPAKTWDINTYSLEALCLKASLEVVDKVHIEDKKEDFQDLLSKDDVDIILFSGSSSKGEKDYLSDLLEEADTYKLILHGLAVKPGKPTILGRDHKKIILGLPGHPVSAFVVFKAFVETSLRRFYGNPCKKSIPAVLDHNMPSAPGRTLYQLTQLIKEGEGYVATPIFTASGNFTTLAKADGYFIIDQNQEGGKKGEIVQVFLLE